MRQGNRPVASMATEMQQFALRTDWNESALRSVFYDALNDDVKDEISKVEMPTDLDQYIELACRIGSRLHERRMERKNAFKNNVQPKNLSGKQSTTTYSNQYHQSNASTSAGNSLPAGDPMQIDATTTRKVLTNAERQRRRENLWFVRLLW